MFDTVCLHVLAVNHQTSSTAVAIPKCKNGCSELKPPRYSGVSFLIQTKKKRKLNDSNEWEMAKPSADIGQFKINFICQAL